MKTVFFIASRFPFPVSNGRDKTLVEYLSFLQSNDIRLHFYYFSNHPNKNDENIFIAKFSSIISIKSLKRPSLFVSLFNVLYRSFFKRNLSIQESFYFSKSSARVLSNDFSSENPDVLFFDMIRTAPYFLEKKFNSALTIFDMDDLLSKRYSLLATHDDVDVLGNFSKSLPFFIRRLANGLFKNILLQLESSFVSKNEVKYANAFSKTLLVSPGEAIQLSRGVRASKVKSIFSLYPSVDLKLLPRDKQLVRTIVFMGQLNVPHNRNALVTFLDKIFPIILEKMDEVVQFLIVGGGGDEGLLQYSHVYPNIKFLGFVEDYSCILSMADVFVAPIYFGTGIKLKILDAIGMGLPVVTTTIGAEGLMLDHGVNAMIADDFSGFASSVVELLKDEKMNTRLSFAALDYAKQYHDYDQLKHKFLNILELSNDY